MPATYDTGFGITLAWCEHQCQWRETADDEQDAMIRIANHLKEAHADGRGWNRIHKARTRQRLRSKS